MAQSWALRAQTLASIGAVQSARASGMKIAFEVVLKELDLQVALTNHLYAFCEEFDLLDSKEMTSLVDTASELQQRARPLQVVHSDTREQLLQKADSNNDGRVLVHALPHTKYNLQRGKTKWRRYRRALPTSTSAAVYDSNTAPPPSRWQDAAAVGADALPMRNRSRTYKQLAPVEHYHNPVIRQSDTSIYTRLATINASSPKSSVPHFTFM